MFKIFLCFIGNQNWWKSHEAAMLALGSVQEVIERQIQAGKVEFDIPGKTQFQIKNFKC